MYGDYYGKQMPTVGNKGISMREGKFSMHGVPLTNTWTRLAANATIGATQIQLELDVSSEWKAGDEIVIASTEYDFNQAEVRKIVSFQANNMVTLN